MTRHAHAPRVADARLGKRVMRYLVGTVSMKLCMTPIISWHHAFTGAEYAGQDYDRKSISAETVRLDGLHVNWYCTKQTTVSLDNGIGICCLRSRCSRTYLMSRSLGRSRLHHDTACRETWKIKPPSHHRYTITPEALTKHSKYIDIKNQILKDLNY